MTSSHSLAFSLISTDSKSSMCPRWENNWWGPFSFCRFYHIRYQHVFNIRSLRIANHWPSAIRYRMYRSYCWRLKIFSMLRGGNPAQISLPHWLDGLNVSINSSWYVEYFSAVTIDLVQSICSSFWKVNSDGCSSVLTVPTMVGSHCTFWDHFRGFSAVTIVDISSFRYPGTFFKTLLFHGVVSDENKEWSVR